MKNWLGPIARICFVSVALFLFFGSSPGRAQAHSCPAHATEIQRTTSTGEVTLTCQCAPGYGYQAGSCVLKPPLAARRCRAPLIQFGGKCENKTAVEDRLNVRIWHALQATRSTMEAIKADRNAAIWSKIRDHFTTTEVAIGSALLKRNPAVLAPEALSIAADLSKLLTDWGTCSATPSLEVECNNLRNFKRILHETAGELHRVEHE